MKKYLIALALMLCLCGCGPDDHSNSMTITNWPRVTVVLKSGEERLYENSHVSTTQNIIYVQPAEYGPFAAFNKVDVDHVATTWEESK